MPHDGRAQAGVSEPPACETDVADTGMALTAVYVPGVGTQELRLVETAGCAASEYGLPERLPLSGDSPATHALRTGRPLWLNPAALTDYSEGGPTPPRAETSLAALALAAEGGRPGCLVVVGPSMDGFEAEQRRFLEQYADAVVVLRAGTGLPAPSSSLGPALQRLRVGSFVLTPDTGRIEADETLLEPAGITPDDVDGKADTLLAHTLPEDMHALMSVLEPSTQAAGRRELEFRVRRPTGEMRRLSLSCQVVAGTDDVSRIQRLNAALDDAVTVRDVSGVVVTALGEPLGADRVALAESQDDRLAVTVLDPPQPAAWPQWWRAEWRSEWPDAPVSALPTLQLAPRDGRMDLWSAGACVSDCSPRAPAKPVRLDWHAIDGRGLLLAEAMSDAFGCVPVAGGKQVWSEIVVPRRERVPADSGPRTERGGPP
ncbi:GAF domain-containing protein [Streptomyces sp. NPDC059837]|uniref:GAF domain-containing protein n=1 Tax=Streptomyces sp. NPDC059837 TaxID=3346968 RepID=UPI0036527E8C